MISFKKVLFWMTFIPLCALMMIVGVLTIFLEAIEEGVHRWEGWCMEYKKNGWTRVGGGIWSKSEEKSE